MGYVKTLLTARLHYYEEELRRASLDDDFEMIKICSDIVTDIKEALELLYAGWQK
jgi:hypothetical protein